MDKRRRPRYHIAVRVAAAHARAERYLTTSLRRVRDLLDGALYAALTEDERQGLGVEVYQRAIGPAATSHELFPWEERCYDEHLPAPPASILLGGAGRGREAVVLARSGYEVTAFEPSEGACRQCGEALTSSGRALRGSYEDLVLAVHGGGGGPLESVAKQRYDVVIMGWGSIMHVTDRSVREAVFRACDELTIGPILSSFYLAHDDRGRSTGSRAYRLGASIGRRLGSTSLIGQRPTTVRYVSWAGWLRPMGREELERISEALHRDLVLTAHPEYAHAAMIKR